MNSATCTVLSSSCEVRPAILSTTSQRPLPQLQELRSPPTREKLRISHKIVVPRILNPVIHGPTLIHKHHFKRIGNPLVETFQGPTCSPEGVERQIFLVRFHLWTRSKVTHEPLRLCTRRLPDPPTLSRSIREQASNHSARQIHRKGIQKSLIRRPHQQWPQIMLLKLESWVTPHNPYQLRKVLQTFPELRRTHSYLGQHMRTHNQTGNISHQLAFHTLRKPTHHFSAQQPATAHILKVTSQAVRPSEVDPLVYHSQTPPIPSTQPAIFPAETIAP